jgi:hypothetical protein
LPVYTRKVQDLFSMVAQVIRAWSNKLAQPVVAVKSWWAGFHAALKHLNL